MEDHSWVCSEDSAVAGHGLRGAVVGWYLPVLVVDERQMKEVGGARVVVPTRRVAVGRTSGGVEQAVGIRCRQEWHRHRMGREQLVGTTGQRVQADGGREVLMEGQEIWEEWTGKVVDDTEWRKGFNLGTMGGEVVRWGWRRDMEQDKVERDKVYDKG